MEIQNCSNSLPTPNSRREFLRQTGMGLGTVAFGTMVADYLVAPARAEITAYIDSVRDGATVRIPPEVLEPPAY